MSWEPGQVREVDGLWVELVRRVDGDLWVVKGGYVREVESRLVPPEEVAAYLGSFDRWETLFAASDLGDA